MLNAASQCGDTPQPPVAVPPPAGTVTLNGATVYYAVEAAPGPELAVGAGVVHAIEGYCFAPGHRLRALSLRVGDAEFPIDSIREPREDLAARFARLDPDGAWLTGGFRGQVSFPARTTDAVCALALAATFARGTSVRMPIGETRLRAGARAESPVPASDGPLIAICLASYRPEPLAFRRQIDSLIAQTYRNWICTVCDDGSGPEAVAQIREICARDSRFRVVAGERNLGFYRNFERGLCYTPRDAVFIALADQDDYWYPDKLERCLGAFSPDIALVYSDMRIVRPDGTVVADSYWTNRRNNYTDLDIVMLANTVTGAAALFRAALLDKLLPFPERIGDAFHDHWLACTALLAGRRLGYVDAPLYDYVQHGAAVIGHCDFGHVTFVGRLRALARAVAGRGRGTGLKAGLLRARAALLGMHRYEYRRLQLFAATLRLRFPHRSAAHERALRMFDGDWWSVARLLAEHLSIWRRGATTDDAELRLAGGFLAYRFNRLYMRLARRRLARRYARA